MKKAVITGANGFIGSFLTKYLAEKGIKTTAFILKGTDCDFLKIIYPSLENVTIIEGDILNKESLYALVQGMDYIIHLAGVIQGYNQEDFDRINVRGTENLLEVCSKSNSKTERIVLVSSSAAAGPGTLDHPLTEDMELQPLLRDFYGISKYRMEKFAAVFKSKLPITIIRPSIVLGPGNKAIRENYKLIELGFKFQLHGAYRPLCYIDVEDLVEGIYLCLVKPEAVGEAFYFCSDKAVSLSEFQEIGSCAIFNRKYGKLITITVRHFIVRILAIILEGINKIQKKPAPFYNQSKSFAAFAPGQVIKADKAKRLLGWKPKYSIVDAIIREGNWFIAQGWIKNGRTNHRKK